MGGMEKENIGLVFSAVWTTGMDWLYSEDGQLGRAALKERSQRKEEVVLAEEYKFGGLVD